MEFLRFGSSIPGGYWGCCGICIIQNFKVPPDKKASIQIVNGDGGHPMFIPHTNLPAYSGPTYRDIFWQRLRYGTFGTGDMPNQIFFASLTQSQIDNSPGKDWLEILHEAGFEFVRRSANSVYTGSKVGKSKNGGNAIFTFALYRNIGTGGAPDMLKPPRQWVDLNTKGRVVPELIDLLDAAQAKTYLSEQEEAHRVVWKRTGPTKFISEKELLDAGAPIIRAGRRVPDAMPLDITEAVKARLGWVDSSSPPPENKSGGEAKSATAPPNPFQAS